MNWYDRNTRHRTRTVHQSMSHPSKKTLRQYFEYREDGVLVWKRLSSTCAKPGVVAGCLNKNMGYIVIRLKKILYAAHRLIWIYHHGAIKGGYEIDHINRKRYDNRIENLRCVTRSGNRRNTSAGRRNRSGNVGVHLLHGYTNKWVAQIRHAGKVIHLGCFDSKEKAIEKRTEAEVEYGYITHIKYD